MIKAIEKIIAGQCTGETIYIIPKSLAQEISKRLLTEDEKEDVLMKNERFLHIPQCDYTMIAKALHQAQLAKFKGE